MIVATVQVLMLLTPFKEDRSGNTHQDSLTPFGYADVLRKHSSVGNKH